MAVRYAVHGTNDQSIASKLSAAIQDYFVDDSLVHFVKKPCRRAPLINRGYYIRFKAMEYSFNVWLQTVMRYPGRTGQVISLGAGFDTTYFRLKMSGKLKHVCKYVEIDFPEVLVKKLVSILTSKELASLFTECKVKSHANIPQIVFEAPDYALLGFNLDDIKEMESLFEIIGVNFHLPTLFLAECSLTYMDLPKSDELITWLCKKFPRSDFILYEQICPDDGFGKVMKNHFSAIGSPLKSVDSYPDLKSLSIRFLKAGYSQCHVADMNLFFGFLPKTEVVRFQNLESFDEYEMWHQKCSHYALVYASKTVMKPFPTHWKYSIAEMDGLTFKRGGSYGRIEAGIRVQRWGHKMVQISASKLLINGGFGLTHQQHQRLTDFVYYDLKSDEIVPLHMIDPDNLLGCRMFHTVSVIRNNRVLVFGGRSSPERPYGTAVLLFPIGVSLNGGSLDYLSYLNPTLYGALKKQLSFMTVLKKVTTPRWRHSASVICINGNENILFFGGCTPTATATDDSLLLSTHTWTLAKIPKQGAVPSPRHSHSAAECDQKEVFVSGGLSAMEKCLNSVHVFHADTCSWFRLNVKGLLPRYSHTSHICERHLILIGGVNDLPGCLPYVAVINLDTLVAVELLMPSQEPDDIVLLHCHSSVLTGYSIIVSGGGGNCFSFGTHFNKDILVFDAFRLISLCH